MPLVKILEELVSFPTVSGDLVAANGCLDHAQGYLKERGMTVTRHASRVKTDGHTVPAPTGTRLDLVGTGRLDTEELVGVRQDTFAWLETDDRVLTIHID